MPRPVIFDLYNTLVHGSDEGRARNVGEMAVMLGVDPSALITAYHDSWPERIVRWDVEETIRILTGRLGARPTDAQVAQAAQHRRAYAGRTLGAVPAETIEVLDRLRAARHQLALISNATSDAVEAWAHCVLADRFDAVLFSCEFGAAKPDPAIYLAAADRLGVAPEDCLFVGDGSDDELAGAVAVGMRAVRTTQYVDRAPAWTGQSVTTLAEFSHLCD